MNASDPIDFHEKRTSTYSRQTDRHRLKQVVQTQVPGHPCGSKMCNHHSHQDSQINKSI